MFSELTLQIKNLPQKFRVKLQNYTLHKNTLFTFVSWDKSTKIFSEGYSRAESLVINQELRTEVQ